MGEETLIEDLLVPQWKLKPTPGAENTTADLYYGKERVGTLLRDHAPAILVALRTFG